MHVSVPHIRVAWQCDAKTTVTFPVMELCHCSLVGTHFPSDARFTHVTVQTIERCEVNP